MVLHELDRQLPKLEEGSSASAYSMENVLAEVEYLLSYCNDILCTGNVPAHTVCSEAQAQPAAIRRQA